jgi:hypothetical protein
MTCNAHHMLSVHQVLVFGGWQEENAGLVKLVVDSQTKRNVQRLTQTYLTLSLPDMAAAVGLPSAQAAELAILRCVACCSDT